MRSDLYLIRCQLPVASGDSKGLLGWMIVLQQGLYSSSGYLLKLAMEYKNQEKDFIGVAKLGKLGIHIT